MPSNFRINGIDTDDIFVRKEIFREGNLWIWGENDYGQLGTGTTTVGDATPAERTRSRGTNWKIISAGFTSGSGIKTDGTLWMWGQDGTGQFGTNGIVDYSSPVQTVSAGTNWRTVSSGFQHRVAIKTNGTLWTWGRNDRGQLGDNTALDKSSPVQTVSGGTNWMSVAAGELQTAAIKTDGTLWLWGANANGQLGDNTRTHRSSPVQTVAGGTNWRQVASGSGHTAAIKTDGTLWLWGYNFYGQLGDNTNIDKSSPIQNLSAGSDWKQVVCGFHHTVAVKTNGTLWLWGRNNSGQLGDNTITNRSSPIQTVSAGTTWRTIAADASRTGAIKTDGTLWLWGGSGSYFSSLTVSSPVQVSIGGTNWRSISFSQSDSGPFMALRSDE